MSDQIGRYQLVPHPKGYILFFIDTVTGRIWQTRSDDSDGWGEMKSPLTEKAAADD